VRLLNLFKKNKIPKNVNRQIIQPMMYAGQQSYAPVGVSIWDGGKFDGGFGPTELQITDYWTLRQRSEQLFNENLYAKGIIQRFATNVIATGLIPEVAPEESVLGVPEDSLSDWSDTVEKRFDIWSMSERACDYLEEQTFGQLQHQAYVESIISGDVLIVLVQSKITKMPRLKIIKSEYVRSPFLENQQRPRSGNEIVDGVELDSKGRQVAYWVEQKDGELKRLPAFGERSGRRIAWMFYGLEKRVDGVRGQPLLGVLLQSLKEIDRYRDAAQRKAVVNSMLAMFIKKTEDKIPSLPLTRGATRSGELSSQGTDGVERKHRSEQLRPGTVVQTLQQGEEPVGFGGDGTDVNFPAFEEAIVQAMAWSTETPPEILRMSFSSNYSASQAAIIEYKLVLTKIRARFGAQFCSRVYVEFLLSETLLGKIDAPGLLDAWRDLTQYDTYAAWIRVEWYGSIKPSTNMNKEVQAAKVLVAEGWSTNRRVSRELTGTDYNRNIKRIATENVQKVEALRPLFEFVAQFDTRASANALTDLTALAKTNVGINTIEEVENGTGDI
jgi:lambda family phage portal protein